MSMICIAVGVTVLVMFVLPTTRRLQSEFPSQPPFGAKDSRSLTQRVLLDLPMSAWRVKIPA